VIITPFTVDLRAAVSKAGRSVRRFFPLQARIHKPIRRVPVYGGLYD